MSQAPQIESAGRTRELDSIIRSCLAKAPSDRLATAAELADQLSQWLRRNHPSRLARWRRGWRLIVVMAAGCILGCFLIWAILNELRREEIQTSLKALETARAQHVPGLVGKLHRAGATLDSVKSYPRTVWANGYFGLDVAAIRLGDRRTETLSRFAGNLRQSDLGDAGLVLNYLYQVTPNSSDLFTGIQNAFDYLPPATNWREVRREITIDYAKQTVDVKGVLLEQAPPEMSIRIKH